MDVLRLAEQVEGALSGPAWHGASLEENLRGLTFKQAVARPVPDAHSIWELVLHITAWAEEVTRRMDGAEPATPAGGDWPAVGAISPGRGPRRWRDRQTPPRWWTRFGRPPVTMDQRWEASVTRRLARRDLHQDGAGAAAARRVSRWTDRTAPEGAGRFARRLTPFSGESLWTSTSAEPQYPRVPGAVERRD